MPVWISWPAVVIYILITVVLISKQREKVKKLDRLVDVRTKELRKEMEKNKKLFNINFGLKEMVLTTVVAVVIPVVVGMILGVTGVVGMLAGATVSGFLLAIFMSNSGGAWDNAKKYIESGVHGGKGSDQHKAAVVGDTVGDPFKDTSGPAINILIKLLSMVSIVFAALVVKFHLL